MLIDEFLCKRDLLGKRAPHSFTPPSKCGRCVQQYVISWGFKGLVFWVYMDYKIAIIWVICGLHGMHSML
jgi:hypothetical protein